EQTVTVVASGKLVERRRRAIRVLNALAADQALCAASYLRGTREIRALDAWQVSPDGAVRRFGRKDALDLSEAGTWTLYSEARRLVISAVEPRVGTVFAFESVAEETPLFAAWQWDFDGDEPVM